MIPELGHFALILALLVAAASGNVPSYEVPIMPTLPVDQEVARTSSRLVGLV
mgnify:CR=1 FL=1